MTASFDLVPEERLELSLCRQNRILSPARLPVPPFRRGRELSFKASINPNAVPLGCGSLRQGAGTAIGAIVRLVGGFGCLSGVGFAGQGGRR